MSCFQKSAYKAGIKIFNNIPSSFKSVMNEKAQFQVALERCLNIWETSSKLKYTHDEFLLPKNDP
jgi:hypothetical protein